MTFVITLVILVILIVCYYISENSAHSPLNFFDGLYEIAIAIMALVCFFALMFLLIFKTNYNNTINKLDTLYNDIYFMEQYIDNPKMVIMIQDKINEYECEKQESITFGLLSGQDVSELRAYPTLEIGESGIVES